MGSYVKNNLVSDEQIQYQTYHHWVIFISLRSIFTLFIAPLKDRYFDEFAITNKRIIIKTGFISRKTLEMNLSKIESVNVNQSVLGRILDFGDLTIIGTGGTHETFKTINHPITFRKKFQELAN